MPQNPQQGQLDLVTPPGPYQGPFTDVLMGGLQQQAQPQQQQKFSGYEGATGKIAGIADQFIQGVTRGRVVSMLKSENERLSKFKTFQQYAQMALSNPNLTDEQRNQINQQYMQVIGQTFVKSDTGKGGKGKEEGMAGKVLGMFKEIGQGMTGGKMPKGKDIDFGDATLSIAKIGQQPGRQEQAGKLQAQLSDAAGKASEQGGAWQQEFMSQHAQPIEALRRTMGQKEADAFIGDLAGRFPERPKPGSAESVNLEVLGGGEGVPRKIQTAPPPEGTPDLLRRVPSGTPAATAAPPEGAPGMSDPERVIKLATVRNVKPENVRLASGKETSAYVFGGKAVDALTHQFITEPYTLAGLDRSANAPAPKTGTFTLPGATKSTFNQWDPDKKQWVSQGEAKAGSSVAEQNQEIAMQGYAERHGKSVDKLTATEKQKALAEQKSAEETPDIKAMRGVTRELGEQRLAQLKAERLAETTSPANIAEIMSSHATNRNTPLKELGGLTPAGLEQTTKEFLANNGKMPSLGLVAKGDVKIARMAIINYAGYLADKLGMDTPTISALYKANSKAASDNIGRVARVDAVSKALGAQFPRLAELSAEVGNLGIQESDLTAGKAAVSRKFGSVAAGNYVELIQTVRSDYAAMQAALAGSRGGQQFAKNAADAIPVGLTPDQYLGIQETIQRSASVSVDAVRREVGSLMSATPGIAGGGNRPPEGAPRQATGDLSRWLPK